MNAIALSLLLLSSAAAAAGPARAAEPPLRRFAVVAGANDGGADRIPLKYAASDARSFARVLEELGGVSTKDTVLLVDGDSAGLRQALAQVGESVRKARTAGERVQLVLYYSGHSDEEGLLIRGQRVPYTELRDWLGKLGAEVRIAVLDSCSSGALTRGKGGRRVPAFMSDASAQVSGHAFLTSSSADEASQESDRLRASFFTHYLVSGLRGAADLSHDGRVTLGEAYQFAFQETLARTEKTQQGAQHPAFDLQLAGTGEVVVTDLRGISAGLFLSEELSGRIFVRDAAGNLVAELNKAAGRSVELGLEPGEYQISVERKPGELLQGTVRVDSGARAPVRGEGLAMQPLELTASRGGAPVLAPDARPAFGGYRTVPVSLGVFRGLDTAAPVDDARVVFALNLSWSHSAALSGMAISTIASTVNDGADGMQVAGLLTAAGGPLRGLQVAGLYAGAGGVEPGVQAAGLVTHSGGMMNGWQVAGLAALASNERAPVNGVQTAGVFSYASGGLRGFQISGLANITGNAAGGQIALVNIAGDVSGAQIGLVNVAGGTVRGAQIGLVNVAGHQNGWALGLLNFAPEIEVHPQLWADELLLANAAAWMGTKYWHSILGIGFSGPMGGNSGLSNLPVRWGLISGLGVGADLGPAFGEFDATITQLNDGTWWDSDDAGVVAARLTIGVHLAPRVTVVAGVTQSFFISAETPPALVVPITPHTYSWGSTWTGGFVGLRI